MVLQCDICGGVLQMDAGGETATCSSCGMVHSIERVRQKVQEIKGIVKIDGVVNVNGLATSDTLAENIQVLSDLGELERALLECNKLREQYPGDYRGWWLTEKISLEQQVNTIVLQYGDIYITDKLPSIKLTQQDFLKNALRLSDEPEKLIKELEQIRERASTNNVPLYEIVEPAARTRAIENAYIINKYIEDYVADQVKKRPILQGKDTVEYYAKLKVQLLLRRILPDYTLIDNSVGIANDLYKNWEYVTICAVKGKAIQLRNEHNINVLLVMNEDISSVDDFKKALEKVKLKNETGIRRVLRYL